MDEADTGSFEFTCTKVGARTGLAAAWLELPLVPPELTACTTK